MRAEKDDNMEKLIGRRRMEGIRQRRRSPKRWLDQVKPFTGA